MAKASKKLIAILLTLLTLMPSALLPATAAGEGITALTFNGLDEDRFSVSWWKSETSGKYFAFLPADADLTEMTVAFTADADVYVGDEKLVSGEATDIFSDEGEYTLTCGALTYPLIVMQSANIPAMYIETASGSLDYVHADKSNKEAASIAVVHEGEVVLDTELSYIKGRGNSTWNWAKKPYNIKFDKKTDLFGMGKAKKWSLLASYNDIALIRNKIVFDFSDDLGLMYSSKSQPVDLYINGEYQGNYLVCESVETGSTRVDIDDLDDANEEANAGIDIEALPQLGDITGSVGSMKWIDIPTDPSDITGGYLIEMELYSRYAAEASGFITNIGQPVVVKSPEYASKAQVEYISTFYQELEEAIFSETGYNSLGKHYSEYIDLESVAKMYLVEEFTMDIDAGKSSAYFYKEAGEDTKLIASPVWDFDYSLGNGMAKDNIRSDDPEIWFTSVSFVRAKDTLSGTTLPTIFAGLMAHEEFYDLVCEEWNDVFAPIMERYLTKVDTLVAELNASALMNSARWANAEDNLDSIEACQEYYDSKVDIVANFMEKRLAALNKGFSSNSARLYFDMNGGTGLHNNYTIATAGEAVEIKLALNVEAPEGSILHSWNTEPDGSGDSYQAGDKIVLEQGKTVLYAQYMESKLFSVFEKLLERFIEIVSRLLEVIRSLISLSAV